MGSRGWEPLRRHCQNFRLFLGAPLQVGGCLLGWEYALINRAGLLNETGPVEVTFRYELYHFAHFAHHGRRFGGIIPPMIAGMGKHVVSGLLRRKSRPYHK